MVRGLWKINGVAIAAPSEMRAELREVTSSEERNLLGDTVMDFFGTRRTLSLSWAFLPEDALANMIAAAGTGFFSVFYPDPDGSEREITCYFGRRRAGVKMLKAGRPIWTGVEMELIER